MNKPVVLLGATSSMARAIAGRLAAEQTDLVLAGRNEEELQRNAADLRIRHNAAVAVQYFDAADWESHQAFFDACLQHGNGEVGGVVLCHGFMAEQAAAQKDFSLARQMIDVNYTSAVSVLNRFANYMEQTKTGFICAVSSVAGDRGRQSNYLYGSTKAALNTFMEGMRIRLAKVGVPVLTVKPGFVDTRMTWGLPGLFLVATPDRVAGDLCKAIRKRRDEIYTPWFWWGIMTIICHIPRFLFKRMKM